jgi:hypothetical protein
MLPYSDCSLRLNVAISLLNTQQTRPLGAQSIKRDTSLDPKTRLCIVSLIELHQYALLINLHPVSGACLLPQALCHYSASRALRPPPPERTEGNKEQECDMTFLRAHIFADGAALNAFSADFLLFFLGHCIVDKFLLRCGGGERPASESSLMALIVCVSAEKIAMVNWENCSVPSGVDNGWKLNHCADNQPLRTTAQA